MPPESLSPIARNVLTVRDRMARAAARAGRDFSEVRLVAVTKYASLEAVRAVIALGVSTLGESRPQQFAQRATEFDAGVEWHFIGHLQRNKVPLVVPGAAMIHSVDSLRLLERVRQVADETHSWPELLLEVNVSGEASKDGFAPEELERAWEQIVAIGPARIVGLMTMAPESHIPEDARPHFAALRQLRDHLQSRSPAGLVLRELSMGMSGDFEIAIEEGATLVRVGSALFEENAAT